jgi:hypothetical protein
MAREVITKQVTIAGSGYNSPPRVLHVGEVVELSASEITAVTTAGGTVRSGATARDLLGESFGASNSS